MATLDELGQRHAEWRPWLAVVEIALRECADPVWDRSVPENVHTTTTPGAPLLDGASFPVDGRRVRRFAQRLFATAARQGTDKMQSLGPIGSAFDDGALLAASIVQDGTSLAALARTRGSDPDAAQAVASLLALPLLHACRRASAAPAGWAHGYCFVCGSWPAFAEVRGIERSRHLRCGRCGAEWLASQLSCAYCRLTDHERLRSLVVEGTSPHSIDVCQECHGYVKTFTTLRGRVPETVMLEDMATVDLDVAAVTRGYARREGSAVPIRVTIADTRPGRRLFAWNA